MNAIIRTACLAVFIVTVNSNAQTTMNPDISAVGDVRLSGHNDKARSDEKNEINLQNPEVELLVSGYLNPYARADFVIAWHGEHTAEIEEAYATILRGLPFGINLRAGKYLLEFGRLNPVHPHAFSFVSRPLPHAYFFGEEGLSDMAVRVSLMVPAGGAYSEVMGGLLRGDALAEHDHGEVTEDDHAHEGKGDRDPGFFGRLTSSLAVSEYSELAFGGSVLNVVYALSNDSTTPEQPRSWLFGGDIKYKYKPSRYTSLQIESEGIMRLSDSEDGDDLTSYGAYAYVDYRFRQKYNVGSILEWVTLEEAEHAETSGEHEIHKHDIWRAGLFAGFAPIEETSLVRLTGHWSEPEESDGFWELTLQFVFSLGPHQPHNF